MTSEQVKWNWSRECQKEFDRIKKLVSKETLLSYPNFNELFETHTDASKLQLGPVIIQYGKLIAFYSRKYNPTQVNYTTIERELLSIDVLHPVNYRYQHNNKSLIETIKLNKDYSIEHSHGEDKKYSL